MNSEEPNYKCFIHGPDGLDVAYHLTRAQVGEILLILGEADPANDPPIRLESEEPNEGATS